MPTPQELNASMIEQIASQRLGQAPGQPLGGAPALPPGAPGEDPGVDPNAAPPAKPKASEKPTDMEKAASKLEPKDSGSVSDEESIRMVKIGDREFAESQIKGMYERYTKLNHQWQTEVAPNKASLAVINNLVKMAKDSGHDVKPDEVAALIDAAVKAYVKNPTMGGDDKKAGKIGADEGKQAMSGKVNTNLGDNDDEMEESFSSWEKENAVSLPPGFKDVYKANKSMEQKMQAMLDVVQQLITGQSADGNAVATGAEALKKANQLSSNAATSMIRNNLNQAFSSSQIPSDDATKADFRMFAMQRGYDFPDFMDPELTATVVADYKANKDAPEIERLRGVMKKRQAFSGLDTSTPGAGGGASAQAGADPMLSGLVDKAMAGRR